MPFQFFFFSNLFILIRLAQRDHNVFPQPDNLATDMEEHTSGSWRPFKKHYSIKRAHLSNLSGSDTTRARSDDWERIRYKKKKKIHRNPHCTLPAITLVLSSRDWKRKVYVSAGDKRAGNNGCVSVREREEEKRWK